MTCRCGKPIEQSGFFFCDQCTADFIAASDRTASIATEAVEEIQAQMRKWGIDRVHPGVGPGDYVVVNVARMLERVSRVSQDVTETTWANILGEEVGEAIRAEGEEARRAELVQVAAVALAWIDAIDRARGT